MTFNSDYQVATLEPGAMGTADNGQPKLQTIVTGPVAATVPMEQLGTNGGGFFGVNFAHPFQSPTAFTNFLGCFAMMLFPFSLVLMYGRMLKRVRHSVVIFFGDDGDVDRNRRLDNLLRYNEAESGTYCAPGWSNV